MNSNPLYPANKDELNALAPVLELTCLESKTEYEKEKAQRRNIKLSDVVGRPYRACVITSHLQVLDGECSKMLDDVLNCNKNNEYTYARQCMGVRNTLLECAAKNKVGELGKDFMA